MLDQSKNLEMATSVWNAEILLKSRCVCVCVFPEFYVQINAERFNLLQNEWPTDLQLL